MGGKELLAVRMERELPARVEALVVRVPARSRRLVGGEGIGEGVWLGQVFSAGDVFHTLSLGRGGGLLGGLLMVALFL